MASSAAFRVTLRRLAAASPSPTIKAAAAPLSKPAPNLIVPGIVIFGTVFGIASLVRSQLRHESETIDRMFSKQYSPEVLEARKKHFLIDTEGDPRKSIYNVLNWGR